MAESPSVAAHPRKKKVENYLACFILLGLPSELLDPRIGSKEAFHSIFEQALNGTKYLKEL
jgi:hypothetical protein